MTPLSSSCCLQEPPKSALISFPAPPDGKPAGWRGPEEPKSRLVDPPAKWPGVDKDRAFDNGVARGPGRWREEDARPAAQGGQAVGVDRCGRWAC